MCVCVCALSHHQSAAHWRAGRSYVWGRVCLLFDARHLNLHCYSSFPFKSNGRIQSTVLRHSFCLHVLWACVYRKGNSILEMDDEGGRMFLRVLIHLIMHNYAPLVSGALQLLFRHFSQRQEVLHTFKQVNTHKQGLGLAVILAKHLPSLPRRLNSFSLFNMRKLRI